MHALHGQSSMKKCYVTWLYAKCKEQGKCNTSLHQAITPHIDGILFGILLISWPSKNVGLLSKYVNVNEVCFWEVGNLTYFISPL